MHTSAHLNQAEQINVEFQRKTLTDMCMLLLSVGCLWMGASFFFPAFWASMTLARQGVLLNWLLFIGFSSVSLGAMHFVRSRLALHGAAMLFVAGSFMIACIGMVHSGFGVRALAFLLLPITLTFITFHYGTVIALRVTVASVLLVVLAGVLEAAGLIRAATREHQPYAFVALTLTVMMFVTINLLFARFEGRFKRLLAVYETQRLQLQDSLHMMQLSLARKRSFAKLLSHSTRTPLAGIQFVLDLLNRKNLTAPILQRTLSALSRHAFRLRMMAIHLDLARRARDPDPLPHVYAFNPYDVWNVCLATLSAEASAKNIALSFEAQGFLPQPEPASAQALPHLVLVDAGVVECDASKEASASNSPAKSQSDICVEPQVLAELISALVDNAIKAQSGGSIDVKLTIDQDGFCCVEVSDEASGMRAEQAQQAMRPLGLLSDDQTADSHEGLGLGLPVLKTLCDQYGGDLAWQARANGGSVFSFKLPASRESMRLARERMLAPVVTSAKNAADNAANHVGHHANNAAPQNLARAPSQASFPSQDNPDHEGSLSDSDVAGSTGVSLEIAKRSSGVLKIYLIVLATLALLSTLNQAVQMAMGSELARMAIVNAAGSTLMLGIAVFAYAKNRKNVAAGVLVANFLIFAFSATIIIGMGPRSPTAIIPAAAIALAHFQFGKQTGGKICALSCVILVFSFLLERGGLIPGMEGALFPPSINMVMALIPVYLLSFIAAYELQGRSEMTFEAMRAQNRELESALYKATLADFSQNRFLQAVSPRLIAQCHELADVCDFLAREAADCARTNGHLESPTVVRLRLRAAELNSKLTAEFDDAVGAVDQNTPPLGLQVLPALTVNALDTPSKGSAAAAGDVRALDA